MVPPKLDFIERPMALEAWKEKIKADGSYQVLCESKNRFVVFSNPEGRSLFLGIPKVEDQRITRIYSFDKERTEVRFFRKIEGKGGEYLLLTIL